MKRSAACLTMLLLLAGSLDARTVTLTAEDCDQMAALSPRAPRLSWACLLVGEKSYYTENQVQLHADMALLMRFSLARIPPKQRITKAEFSMPVAYLGGGLCEISVRRLVADWGLGVCHLYRRTHPEKIEWTKPGGRGASTDRANKDSAVFRFDKVGEYTVDVTEDVELWYTGAVPNRGWILAFENQAGPAYTHSPYSPQYGGGKKWKLQVTYEPQ